VLTRLALVGVALLSSAPAAHAAFLLDAGTEQTVTMSHLPGWVQVASSAGTLFTTATGSQRVQGDRLPRAMHSCEC
jgi:hypothetical protein